MKKIYCLGLCLTMTILLFAAWGNYAFASGSPARENIRPYPAPYSAMLAICSDIDGTTPEEFKTIHTFLNTTDMTEMGAGLGLDVADSFWMYMGNNETTAVDQAGRSMKACMTYFDGLSSIPKDGQAIREYIAAGWIDSMHTYGDFSRVNVNNVNFSREYAKTAAAELERAGVTSEIWINHGNSANVQNVRGLYKRAFSAYQKGGNPESKYYHADLSAPLGFKYYWFSAHDSRFGMKSPLYPVTLENGQKVWGFYRYTGDTGPKGEHKYNWNIFGLHEQLSVKNLDNLVKNKQCVVVAQHLGGGTYYNPFITEGVASLRRLASCQADGQILVARTSRLLHYIRTRDYMTYRTWESEGKQYIDILGVSDPQLGNTPAKSWEDFRGITFYTNDPLNTVITVGGQPVPEMVTAPAAGNERASVGIAWHPPISANSNNKVNYQNNEGNK